MKKLMGFHRIMQQLFVCIKKLQSKVWQKLSIV